MEEILHQLIGSLSHFLQGFIHPKWCRISSINSTSKLPYICILVDSSQFGEFFRKSLHWLHRQNLLSIPSPFKNQGLLIRYTGSLKVAARTLIFWKIHLQLVLFVFFAACTRARASNMNCWQARIPLCLHASTGGCDARTNPALLSVVIEGEVFWEEFQCDSSCHTQTTRTIWAIY